MTEILAVQQSLTGLIEEIERLEGERRHFDNEIAFSTLTVEVAEPEALISLRPSNWRPLQDSLKESIRVFAESLGALALFLVVVAPWAALFWFITWAFLRLWKRRKA